MVNAMVILVIFVVSLVVLLFVAQRLGGGILESASKRSCQWNLVLNALTKAPIVATESIPPERILPE